MASNEDTSTRTIASVAAVLAILALGLALTESARSGVLAQYISITNEVSQDNEAALHGQIATLSERIEALEKAATAPAPAAEPAADDGAADEATTE